MSLIEMLYLVDVKILHIFNVEWANPYLDQFWLTITHLERQDWFLFGAFPLLIGALLYIYGLRVFRLLIILALGIMVADMAAYRGIKSFVSRPRPFEDQRISSWVRQVGDAQGPSFPSNHAANCFAGALILAYYFKSKRNYIYTFAILVAVSRVALGVHYPSDALAGAMLGIFVGFLVRTFILYRYSWFWLEKPVSHSDGDSLQSRRINRRLSDV